MEYEIRQALLPTYFRPTKIYRPGDDVPLYRAAQKEQITALHHHSCLEIGICISGCGINHVDNRLYHYAAGDIQWVKPYQPHLSATDESVESTWEWLSLDPYLLLEMAGITDTAPYISLLEKGFSGMFHPTEHPDFATAIRRFRESLSAQKRPFVEKEAGLLFAELCLLAARLSEEEFDEDRESFRKIRPCIAYISNNYADKAAMREEVIAGVIGVSPSHLRYLFRREAGVPPRTFILRTRLAAASHRLRNSKASVLQIALDSGFEQISCFNRAFRKEYGMTPSEYRRKKQLV